VPNVGTGTTSTPTVEWVGMPTALKKAVTGWLNKPPIAVGWHSYGDCGRYGGCGAFHPAGAPTLL